MAVSFLPESVSISAGALRHAGRFGVEPASAGVQVRPTFTVIEGGRSERSIAGTTARRRVYRQRQLFVVTVLLALVAATIGLVAVGGGDAASRSVDLPTSYEVSPGDTLWDVAGSLNIDVDRRVVVEMLIEANGGETIHPGQQLVIPAELRTI